MKISHKVENGTLRSGQAKSKWSMMPFHFNIFMKCFRGISDEEADQAELNDRIRMWIQESSLEQNVSMFRTKFPLGNQDLNDQVLDKSTSQPSCPLKKATVSEVPRLTDNKDTPEPMKIVESVVAMVIAPLHFSEGPEQNHLEEFQSKLANIVPETMDHLRVQTQNLLASFENRTF